MHLKTTWKQDIQLLPGDRRILSIFETIRAQQQLILFIHYKVMTGNNNCTETNDRMRWIENIQKVMILFRYIPDCFWAAEDRTELSHF